MQSKFRHYGKERGYRLERKEKEETTVGGKDAMLYNESPEVLLEGATSKSLWWAMAAAML